MLLTYIIMKMEKDTVPSPTLSWSTMKHKPVNNEQQNIFIIMNFIDLKIHHLEE